MGLIISGMHDNPIVVTTTFLRGRLRPDVRARKKWDSAQILLIVKPGIATEARPCHTRVSATAHFTLFFLIFSDAHFFCKKNYGFSIKLFIASIYSF